MTAPDLNTHSALVDRHARHLLLWTGPLLMLAARSAFAVAAQGLAAAIYAMNGSTSAWKDAEAWLPVYGTLIDAGCLALLWWLTRRERIRLVDLIGFDRNRFGRDVLLGLALIPPCLLFIFGGVAASGLVVYGSVASPQLSAPLPFLAALYAVLIWPLIWGFTEQMSYNGYLVPRLQVLSGRIWIAIAVVTLAWSFQHAVMPLTFDPNHMLHRFLSSIPNSIFMIAVYLRMRRLLPLAIAHWLMNGAAAVFAF